MKTSTIVTWVVVLAVVVLGGWYFFSMQNTSPATPSGQTQTNQNPQGSDNTSDTGVNVNVNGSVDINSAPMTATITLTSTGFSPASVTIAKGGTVTWTNRGDDTMWVASASHPAHTTYDNTSLAQHCASGYSGPKPFDQCTTGASYNFTFNQAGTWKYHNHSNPSQFGTVIVE